MLGLKGLVVLALIGYAVAAPWRCQTRCDGTTICYGEQTQPTINPPSICIGRLVPPCSCPAMIYTPPRCPQPCPQPQPCPPPCPPCPCPCPQPCPPPCPSPCPQPCPYPCPICPCPPPCPPPCF